MEKDFNPGALPLPRPSPVALAAGRELEQTLMEWNDTAVAYPRDKCVHELFEAQVERTPDSVALVFEGQKLTYRHLNEHANQLAHLLQARGVGPEVLVGLCLERSVQMVVGLLGILKAGGAYVPLEPTYPKERLQQMVADAQLGLVVTQWKWREVLGLGDDCLVCLDASATALAQASTDNPRHGPRPESLAYVIYTSGSTGHPKGAMNEHGSVCNRLYWMQDRYSLDTAAAVLQKTPFSFDVSVWEFFWPLAVGARLIVARPDGHKDPQYLLNLINREKVAVVHFVPSMLGLFLEEVSLTSCYSLRHVICSGEALSVRLQEHFFRKSTAELSNLYGPTEAAVDVTHWTCLRGRSMKSVPIGRPIANTTAYVLDERRQPVAIGVEGELYIGGIQVGRGYLNRPELTAERFVADPFSKTLGARLYRTGDLVRYLPDGNLEFLGRLDHQVKVRGVRIELGEIEAVLGTHPEIAGVVVVAREDQSDEKYLVAYVVSRTQHGPNVAELREYLGSKLPDYMVPGVFVSLAALPLNTNGKVDRQALPAPDGSARTSGVFVAPRTDIERQLAKIWEDLLQHKNLGVHDNFFHVGGHSLKAVRVVARILDSFQVDLPIKSIFEAPTISGLSRVIAAAQQAGRVVAPIQLLPRHAPGDSNEFVFPTSCGQEQLWFIDQLEAGSVTYHVAQGIRLNGPLQLQALEQSLQNLVCRHESLRTTFRAEGGVPVQVIAPTLTLPLAASGLEHLAVSEREAQFRELIAAETARPFDLVRGPLIRARLFRFDAQNHFLLLTIHHIVCDGWSMSVILGDLSAYYAAICHGAAPELPALSIQYADYAAWHRHSLTPAVVEAHLDYWRQQLSDSSTVLELPADFPRPTFSQRRGAGQEVLLRADLVNSLVVLARQQQTTLFVTLLAAFQTLLYRYSRQSSIVVGSPLAGRTRSETEDLVGFFVNTLPLMADFSGAPSFIELLKQVNETMWQAQDHQGLPFEKLVEKLQPQRHLGSNPIFQVAFVLQSAPATAEVEGVIWNWEEVGTATSKFDLTLSLTESQNGLSGVLEFDTELFTPSTITRLLKHYQNLLAAIVANPRLRVTEVSLLSAAEREHLLIEWNDTVVGYPRDRSIHELFEAQVSRTPDGVAVVFGTQQWTYRQLNERANQLGYYLRDSGIGRADRVGVLLERSADFVVAALGVLKAGAAYVPLDCETPAERLRLLVEDAGVKAVVGRSSPPIGGLPIQFFDWPTLMSALAGLPHSNPPALNAATDPAYVMYTSGSTGMPKGVVVPQRAVVRLVFGNSYLPFDDQQVFLLLAPVQFDASTLELWGPLLHGSKLVVYPDQQLELATFQSVLVKYQVSCLWLTAALFNTIIDQQAEVLTGVRHLMIGGEALSLPHVRRALERLPTTQITNGYGPTETTTFATIFPIPRNLPEKIRSIPIGRPIANTKVYVLDACRQPVPIGVTGELHIGGDGLAQGYLNQPELTVERFVPDPFSTAVDARLYKTGDLVRYLPGGNLEFLGRLDHQVKIRGFRIELGEIEAALGAHPDLLGVVVTDREDQPGEKYLAAYVVNRSQPGPSVSELRDFLKSKLPDYMVPAVFAVLPALPLSPNGKIDRKALPVPDGSLKRGMQFVAPRTEVERQVAAIWERVLGVARISVWDNFFDLGGHSLLAVRLVHEVNQARHLNLRVLTLFQHPTVESFAKILQDHNEGAQKQGVFPLQPGQSGVEVFFILDEGSLGLMHLARLLDSRLPLYASVVALPDDALQAAIQRRTNRLPGIAELAIAHTSQIQKRQQGRTCLLVGHCFGGVLAFEVAQQLQRTGTPVAAVVLLDTWMKQPSRSWWFWTWVRTHFRHTIQQGPKYLCSKWQTRRAWERRRNEPRRHLDNFDIAHGVTLPPEIELLYQHALREYRPQALVSPGRLLLSKADWAANAFRKQHPTLGAEPFFPNGLKLVEVPGDHVTLFHESNLPDLARAFETCLKEFQPK